MSGRVDFLAELRGFEPMAFKCWLSERSVASELEGIVTSALFTCQTRPASVGSDEQNQ